MLKNKDVLIDIFLVLEVLALVSLIVVKGNMYSMDEIWTFQFARRILYHQVPYRDYFMIISPLKAQIDAILLKVFSDQLIVLRWFALFLAYIHGFFLYQISRKLGLDKKSALVVLFVFFLTFIIFPINNYNWFSLFLIVILLFPLSSPVSKKNALWTGFLLSLLILTKQNIGLYMIIGTGFYYYVTQNKYFTISLIGFFLGFLPEVFYFWLKGSLGEFLEIFYANWIPFFNAHLRNKPLTTFLYTVILVLLMLLVLFLISRLKDTPGKNNNILLIVVCLIVLGYSFPIFDVVHFIFLIPFVGLLVLMNRKLQSKTILFFLSFLIFLSGYSWYLFLPKSMVTSYPHLKAIPIDREYAKTIFVVSDYLRVQEELGYNPYEIDYGTALFDVIFDRLGHKYDSMQKGNFGMKGEEVFIEMISKDQKAVVIFDERKQKTQITEYVIKNMTYKETIAHSYLVYVHGQ